MPILKRRRARRCTTSRKRAKNSNSFAVYVKMKDGREGLLRFRTAQDMHGKLCFVPTIVEKLEDASRFIQVKSRKERMEQLRNDWGFLETKSVTR